MFARPQYENYIQRPPRPWRDDQIIEENILLFLAYIGNEHYRFVTVRGYRCVEYSEKYRLLTGPNKNSLFVLEKGPIIDSQFIIHEFIEHLVAEYIFTAIDET